MKKLRLIYKQRGNIKKKMWELVRKLNGTYFPFTVPLLTAPGVQSNLEELADILGGHFSSVSSSVHYTETFLKYKHTAEKQKLRTHGGINDPYNSLITLQELKRALSAGQQTAPGPDDIHYEMLAHFSGASVEALLKFLNKVWVSGRMPVAWKKALIVALLSPESHQPPLVVIDQ